MRISQATGGEMSRGTGELKFNNLVVQLWFVELCWRNPANVRKFIIVSLLYLSKYVLTRSRHRTLLILGKENLFSFLSDV